MLKKTRFNYIWLVVSGLLFSCNMKESQYRPQRMVLDKSWKFQTGDDARYAQSDFDDKNWQTIDAGKSWQEQGHKRYVGYAWYRKSIFLSSTMSTKQTEDTLEINLGVIHYNDQIFLNGHLLAENGRLLKDGAPGDHNFQNYPTSIFLVRVLKIPVTDNRLLWNKVNTLAIRVFSDSDGGGLALGRTSVQMKYTSEDVNFNTFVFYSVINQNALDTVLTINNTNFKTTYKGRFSLQAENLSTHETYRYDKKELALPPGSSVHLPISLATTTDSVKVKLQFVDQDHSLDASDSCVLSYILMK